MESKNNYAQFCRNNRLIRTKSKIREALDEIDPVISEEMYALHIYSGKFWIIEEEKGVFGVNVDGSYISGTLGYCEIALFKSIQNSNP